MGFEAAWHQITSVEVSAFIYHVIVLIVAFLFALPIGWNRERSQRALGLRTFPIVAITSAGYVLVATSILPEGGAEQARIIQGLMTGIGFLGGGAIVKSGLSVQGTATAASIWNTGAIGAAVAYGRFEIAGCLVITNIVVLALLKPFKNEDEPEAESVDEEE